MPVRRAYARFWSRNLRSVPSRAPSVLEPEQALGVSDPEQGRPKLRGLRLSEHLLEAVLSRLPKTLRGAVFRATLRSHDHVPPAPVCAPFFEHDQNGGTSCGSPSRYTGSPREWKFDRLRSLLGAPSLGHVPRFRKYRLVASFLDERAQPVERFIPLHRDLTEVPPHLGEPLRLEVPDPLSADPLAPYESGLRERIEVFRNCLARDPRAGGEPHDRERSVLTEPRDDEQTRLIAERGEDRCGVGKLRGGGRGS
jgi:hypothetical protein